MKRTSRQIEEERRKWRIPDWRNAKSYPHSNEMSDRAWRWEFLRRLDDYRRDWEHQSADGTEYGMSAMVDPGRSDGFIRFVYPRTFNRGATVTSPLALALDPWVTDDEHFNALRGALAYMRLHLHWQRIAKAHRQLWPLYLRALDAETARATDKDIFEILLSSKSKSKTRRMPVSDLLEQAHDLQNRITLRN